MSQQYSRDPGIFLAVDLAAVAAMAIASKLRHESVA